MSECQIIDPWVTPFIDGELGAAERRRVERHLSQCPPCHSRVQAEQSVRSLLRHRQQAFRGECAPVALRVKCAGACGLTAASGSSLRWRRTMMPLAVAATVVLGVSGAVLYYQLARAPRLMAAELTADHVRCFAELGANRDRTSAAAVDAALLSGFGWKGHVPDHLDREGLELVGSRACLYDGERIAHIMYRHHGEPVSVFMVPTSGRRQALIAAAGHECAIWGVDGRTYVLVAREPRADVERLAAIVQPSFQ